MNGAYPANKIQDPLIQVAPSQNFKIDAKDPTVYTQEI